MEQWLMRRLTAPLATLVAALVALFATAPAGAGTLSLADCRLAGPAGSVAARCGWLEVPEDYAAPAGARIRLKVAVVPALGVRGEPLYILAGGPGQAATTFYTAVAPAFAPLARTHDLVLVDQRGTGASARLDCDFPADLATRTPAPAELERLSAACAAALGDRVRHYTTSVAVRDLESVREALGHSVISLYGASYGTRVAQHYARHHAARVRALVLDGVVPTDAILGPDIAPSAQRALALTFARCAAAPGCASAFPDPAADDRTVRAALAQRTVALTLSHPSTAAPVAVSFGPQQYASTLRLLSYSATTSALLPLLVHRAAAGDYRPLAAQFVLYSARLDEEIAYGMHNAVTCTEDAPYYRPADRVASEGTYLGTVEFDALVAMCHAWPAGDRDADLAAPLTSTVPALLLSGEADPVTPPAYGERAARSFANAKHLVLRGQGHGQLGTGCVPDLMRRFLDTHDAVSLDARCTEHAAPPPFFIDEAGPAP